MTPFGPSTFGEAAEMMELSCANLGVALLPFVTSQRGGNFQKRCSHLPRYFTAWRRTLSLNVDKMQFTHEGLLIKRIKQIKKKKNWLLMPVIFFDLPKGHPFLFELCPLKKKKIIIISASLLFLLWFPAWSSADRQCNLCLTFLHLPPTVCLPPVLATRH